jgi:hypothetical protein
VERVDEKPFGIRKVLAGNPPLTARPELRIHALENVVGVVASYQLLGLGLQQLRPQPPFEKPLHRTAGERLDRACGQRELLDEPPHQLLAGEAVRHGRGHARPRCSRGALPLLPRGCIVEVPDHVGEAAHGVRALG